MARVQTRIRRPAPISEALEGLGKRIRKARGEAGLSQAALGAPHFTRAYISAIELGKVKPAMKSLDFLAAKLGKPTSFFLEDEAEEMRRQVREIEIKEAQALLARPTAQAALTKAESLLLTASNPSEICRLRLIGGTALNFLARGQDAIRELTTADRIAEQLRNADLRHHIQHQLALAFRSMSNPHRGREILLTVLREVEAAPIRDQLFRMKLLRDLGALSLDLGENEAAGSYYTSALEWAKDIGDVSGLIAIYNGLAYSHRALGDLDAATGFLQRALGATEVAHDLTAAAVMHNALAVIAADRGHLEKAYEHVNRAIDIARASGPAAYVPHYLSTRAECAAKAGDWTKASAFANEALDAALAVDNLRAAAAARSVLAEATINLGDPEGGERLLEEVAATYRTLGARSELGEVLMRLSRLASDHGDAARAQELASLAYKATKNSSALVER